MANVRAGCTGAAARPPGKSQVTVAVDVVRGKHLANFVFQRLGRRHQVAGVGRHPALAADGRGESAPAGEPREAPPVTARRLRGPTKISPLRNLAALLRLYCECLAQLRPRNAADAAPVHRAMIMALCTQRPQEEAAKEVGSKSGIRLLRNPQPTRASTARSWASTPAPPRP